MSEEQPQPQIVAMPAPVTPDTLKIALLENNNVIYKAISENGDKVTNALTAQTAAFVSQTSANSKDIGTMEAKLSTVQTKLDGIWTKIIGVSATMSTIVGIIGYAIGLLMSHK